MFYVLCSTFYTAQPPGSMFLSWCLFPTPRIPWFPHHTFLVATHSSSKNTSTRYNYPGSTLYTSTVINLFIIRRSIFGDRCILVASAYQLLQYCSNYKSLQQVSYEQTCHTGVTHHAVMRTVVCTDQLSEACSEWRQNGGGNRRYQAPFISIGRIKKKKKSI